jgi:DNA (cytosine-5)-methyltransferase 1
MSTRELIVDNFAGGGGASTGIYLALGRHPDVAINHDPEAIAMHTQNHPQTRHYCEDVWDVDPRDATRGLPVGLAWFSPDCKHFSKAKGGKPLNKKVRGLAWLAVKWAKLVKPRIIVLENVEEFRTWGPLLADGRPCPEGKGKTFDAFIGALQRLGYKVEWRELRASDFGAPTIRKRFFLVARCDGNPIVWPAPTHGPGRIPYRTAADVIDWHLPCPSIFERKRPLAEATMRRIAKGIMRYVIEAREPFIIPVTHPRDSRVHAEPLRTITAAPRGEFALAVPTLIQTGYGERPGQEPRVPGLEKPLGTVMAGGCKHALVAAFLAKHNGAGKKMVVGQGMREPVHTITATDQKALVTSNIIKLRGTSTAHATDEPLHTISAGGTHLGEVRAFLLKYYGTDQAPDLLSPLHTVRTKDCFGLVYVHGEPYAIADVGMRMLTPRELFRAQGFPEDYIIGDGLYGGLRLSGTAQVRMCGNSVCPPLAQAIVDANYIEAEERKVA